MGQHYYELLELSEQIHRREVSPVEVVRAQIARISSLDPTLKAFVRFSPEPALACAHELEAELARGTSRGPLHGVPLAIKDLFWEKGLATAAGMSIHRDFRPPEDATAVRKLKAAGAVILGSLAMTEGAFASYRPPFCAPINPWNADYWPGASSSGSAVAVAAGLCYGSLGTETGGSIHLPSAVNGVTSIKPTWGRVSRHGVFELAGTLDTVGPLARSAADVSVLLSAICGPDELDPTASRMPPPEDISSFHAGVLDLRVGYDPVYAGSGIDEQTAQVMSDAIDVFVELGATITEVTFPDVDEIVMSYVDICSVQAAVAHGSTYPARRTEYGDELAGLLELGRAMRATEYQELLQRRVVFRGRVEAVFDTVDLLILPVMASADSTVQALSTLDDALISKLHRFTCPFTMSGNPAVTLPGGFSTAGTPLSFQLVGRHFDERAALRAAHAFQSVTDWHRRHPRL